MKNKKLMDVLLWVSIVTLALYWLLWFQEFANEKLQPGETGLQQNETVPEGETQTFGVGTDEIRMAQNSQISALPVEQTRTEPYQIDETS